MQHSAKSSARLASILRIRGQSLLRTAIKPQLVVFRRAYRAAQCKEIGKPLVVTTLTSKPLESGQVRVRVCAAGINFADLLMLSGAYQMTIPLPFVAGSELAGEVVEVNEDVSNFKTGDRVASAATNLGAFAEEAICSINNLWHVPSSVDLVTAAALPCSYGTVLSGLRRRVNLRGGETVLVTAAAGAAGLAVIDVASNVLGARVIGAAGGPEKCRLVEERGAIASIDYTRESIRDRTRELTGGEGANVIFESVGGETFNQCVRSAAWEGRILVVGFAGGEVPKIPANILLVKNISVMGFYWGDHGMKDREAFMKPVDEAMKLCGERKISPYIGNTWSLDQVNEALMSIKDRKNTGKVVLTMG